MSEFGDDPGWHAYQARMNEDNLRLLVLLHRIYGGLMAAMSLCGTGYAFFWVWLMTSGSDHGTPSSPEFRLWISMMATAAVGFIVLLAILNLLTATWIQNRRHWAAIVVTSVLNCLQVPLGVGLGVFTLIVLNRPLIKDSFR